MVFVHALKSSPKLFDHANGFSIDWHQCDVLDLEHLIGNYCRLLTISVTAWQYKNALLYHQTAI